MDLSGSSEVGNNDMPTTLEAAPKANRAKDQKPAEDSKSVKPLPYPVEVDHGRDALLTDFGKETLKDRYLLPGES